MTHLTPKDTSTRCKHEITISILYSYSYIDSKRRFVDDDESNKRNTTKKGGSIYLGCISRAFNSNNNNIYNKNRF